MRFLFILILATSCADPVDLKKENQEAMVRITFNKPMISALGFNSTLNPTTTADIDCIGLFVKYPEESQPNICTVNDGSTIAFDRANGLFPVFPGANQINIPVKIGSGRTFTLIGMNKSAGPCPFIRGPEFDAAQNNLSEPAVLAQTTADIFFTATGAPPAPVALTGTITPISSTIKKLTDCTGPEFETPSGGGAANFNPCGGTLNCALWIDPQDSTTFFDNYASGACSGNVLSTSGTAIQCIKNKHNGQAVFSAVNVYDPVTAIWTGTGTKMAVTFSGSQSIQTSTVVGVSKTVAMVFRTPNTAASATLVGASSNANMFSVNILSSTGPCTSAPSYCLLLKADTGESSPVEILTSTNYVLVYSISIDGLSMNGHLYVLSSGSQLTPALTANDPSAPIGFFNFSGFENSGIQGAFNGGQIAEVIVWNQILTGGEEASVVDYLRSRWN